MVRIKHRYLLLNLLYPGTTTTPPPSTSLPPSLAFQAPTPDHLTHGLLARLIRDTVASLFGDHGSGLVNPSLKIMYLSCATSTAIVRVARQHVGLVWAALTMLRRLPVDFDARGGSGGRGGGREVVVRVVRVSGTVRKCEEEVIRRGLEAVRRARKKEGAEGRGMAMLGGGLGRDMARSGKQESNRLAGVEDEDEDEHDEDGASDEDAMRA